MKKFSFTAYKPEVGFEVNGKIYTPIDHMKNVDNIQSVYPTPQEFFTKAPKKGYLGAKLKDYAIDYFDINKISVKSTGGAYPGLSWIRVGSSMRYLPDNVAEVIQQEWLNIHDDGQPLLAVHGGVVHNPFHFGKEVMVNLYLHIPEVGITSHEIVLPDELDLVRVEVKDFIQIPGERGRMQNVKLFFYNPIVTNDPKRIAFTIDAIPTVEGGVIPVVFEHNQQIFANFKQTPPRPDIPNRTFIMQLYLTAKNKGQHKIIGCSGGTITVI